MSEADHDDAEARLAAREFFASALYMALVLLAALVAVPTDRLPSDEAVAGLLVGSAIGLTLAHWLAFRLASHLTEGGGFATESAAREAGAQIAGGVAVAAVAALPFLLLDGAAALIGSLVLLATLPAVTGVAIARLRGRPWLTSLVTGAVALTLAAVVVLVKSAVGH
ncbi:hypothetical protein [Isoptericola sp. b408]|uniref:hypothetical protein n=1 Tax=Isoptericola sp. b408 TaxID=3064653 RepID=UPI002712C95A|nr:hypothetical protein [Isoptericola sp. b408]MDO8150415.1 hypothetical protein [Isoptericola sp. b408]